MVGETFSICWFAPQIATIARLRPDQSHEARIPPVFPRGWQGPKCLGHLSLCIGRELEYPGLESVPIWDAGVAGDSLICCTTMLIP